MKREKFCDCEGTIVSVGGSGRHDGNSLGTEACGRLMRPEAAAKPSDGAPALAPVLTADEAGGLVRQARAVKEAAASAEALAYRVLLRFVGYHGGPKEHDQVGAAYALPGVRAEVQRALGLVRAGALAEAEAALEALVKALRGGEP